MRVLHLTTHLNIGGITTYILRLIKPLSKLGVETFVLTSDGECIPQFEERGAKIFRLPIRTKSVLDPRLYIALPKLKAIIRENKIDMIHAHTRVTQVMAHCMNRQIGIPVVTTCHGFYKRRLGRILLPAWGDCVIAISQSVAEHLERDFKVPAQKIHVVNNAVDMVEIDEAYSKHDAKDAKASFGFKEDDFVVGSISRLVSDKGHEYLIRAIDHLEKDFPNLKLLIVGDGPYRFQLRKLVRELGLEDQVLFTGNVKDVTRPLAALDLFALPATWREGFGLSIVEAMTCRKPVIVSNIWALNTLIQNQVTGILIEPKQVKPLANAIADLIRNPDKRKNIGEDSRKMVREHFNIGRMANEIVATYKAAISTECRVPSSE
jgi:glycosyltransferase involved in cell wall biosynthesis